MKTSIVKKNAYVVFAFSILFFAISSIAPVNTAAQSPPIEGLETVTDLGISAGDLFPGYNDIVQKIELGDNDDDSAAVDMTKVEILGNAASGSEVDASDISQIEILDGGGTTRGIDSSVDSFPVSFDVPVGDWIIPDDGSDQVWVKVTIADPPVTEGELKLETKLTYNEGSNTGFQAYSVDGAAETVKQELKTLRVEFGGSGSGKVSLNGGDFHGSQFDEAYETDKVVDLEASADSSSNFSGWIGDVADPNSKTTTITMDSDKTVTVEFEIKTYTITASSGMNGSISPSGDVSVDHGDNQVFTITPDEDYKIDDVTVDGISVISDVSIDSQGVGTYEFTDVTGDHTIGATFVAEKTLTINFDGTGSGQVTLDSGDPHSSAEGQFSKKYEVGTTVNLEATPNEDSNFLSWVGEVAESSSKTTTTTMDSDKTITAKFDIKTYTISATAGPNGSITPSGDVTVDHGADQQFTIIPDAGYWIKEIVLDGEATPVSGDAKEGVTDTAPNVTADHTLHAEFAKVSSGSNTYTPTDSKWMLVSFPFKPGYDESRVDSVWDELQSPTLYTTPWSGSNYQSKSGTDLVSSSKGYWLDFETSKTINVEGMVVEDNVTIEFASTGWHLISAPYPSDWADVSVMAGEFETASGSDYIRLVSWDGTEYSNHYSNNSYTLSPWYGYWVKVVGLVDGTAALELSKAETNSLSAVQLDRTQSLPKGVDVSELDNPPAPPAASTGEGPLEVVSYSDFGTSDSVTFAVTGEEAAAAEGMKVQIQDVEGQKVFSAESDSTKLTWYAEGVSNGVYVYVASVKKNGTYERTNVSKLLILK